VQKTDRRAARENVIVISHDLDADFRISNACWCSIKVSLVADAPPAEVIPRYRELAT
jgi:ABC-type cobalamin/Fe3+-siderophores transport system ATPase subunit